jgi:fluoride exporter
MGRLLLICLGGALGTAARYGVSVWARGALGAAFPYGTIAVNLIGSFLLGVIMVVGHRAELIPPNLRLALSAGAMGGLTTYSSFNYEALVLFEERSYRVAALYLASTLFGCLVAGFAGIALGKRMVGH